MSKVPTAEEMEQSGEYDDYHYMMIDFARMHVKAALEAAESEAPMYCSENIKNCYPENLIV